MPIGISDRLSEQLGDSVSVIVAVVAVVLAALANDPANIVTLTVIAVLAFSALFLGESDDEPTSPFDTDG